eukprot:9301749-Pyramimonas_sp.AAC.1
MPTDQQFSTQISTIRVHAQNLSARCGSRSPPPGQGRGRAGGKLCFLTLGCRRELVELPRAMRARQSRIAREGAVSWRRTRRRRRSEEKASLEKKK